MGENRLYDIALSKAMARCARRELCCDDIRHSLLSWDINTHDAEKIITKLVNENFINENRYAAAYVRDKFKYNKWGKVKIAANLRLIKFLTTALLLTLADTTTTKRLVAFLVLLKRKISEPP